MKERESTENEVLIRRIQANQDKSKYLETLVNQNQGLIYTIAQKYRGLCEFEDLMQSGNVGLLEAIDRFEVEKGIKFSTFATYWIQLEISKTLENQSIFSISRHLYWLILKYEQFISRYEKEHGMKPSRARISQSLKIDDKTIATIEKCLKLSNMRSLDERLIGDTDALTLADTLKDDTNIEEQVLDGLYSDWLSVELWSFIGKALPEQESEALIQFYNKELTFDFIGDNLGITASEARRTHQKALSHLRKPKNRATLHKMTDLNNSRLYHNSLSSFKIYGSSNVEFLALKAVDGLEKIREQNRIRQARFKEKHNNNTLVTLPVTLSNATDIELELELDKERDKEEDIYLSNTNVLDCQTETVRRAIEA